MKYIAVVLHRLRAERGQALLENALILAIVALACIVVLGLLSAALIANIETVTDAFP